MTFKFRWLCELLDELYQQRYQKRATRAIPDDSATRIVRKWFASHGNSIRRSGPSAVAFLSCLFPERRPDRSYNIQQKRLANVFGRVLGLGASRLAALRSWHGQDGQDFASCVEKVMSQAEFDTPQAKDEITLELLDKVLDQVAANCSSSAPKLREISSPNDVGDLLGPIIRRLQSWEAKWLVRMILKSYNPVEVPEYVALHAFHFMLPKLLSIQNSFASAVDVLSQPKLQSLPFSASKEHAKMLMLTFEQEIQPQMGTMIQRQPYDKARSIKHCCKISGSRTMSVERKYDGEYCQIHVDLSKGKDCIQIFSKSGRDSTIDRFALHPAIVDGLRLGTSQCKVKRRCILEGELVPWSRAQQQILPFYHVRKHVLHGGRRIGVHLDSPRKTDENLMVVFYDVLLLDDVILLNSSHKSRRAVLKSIISQVPDTVRIVERVQINFTRRRMEDKLRKTFAIAIAERWEGLVLKGVDDAYFSWTRNARAVKLKKDYITGLGDSADLCVVAGHRDAQAELHLNMGPLSWTHFHVGCLLNKDAVRRHDERPHFRMIDIIGPASMSREDMLEFNMQAQLSATNFVTDHAKIQLEENRYASGRPTHIFTEPLIAEIMGAGYERPQAADYWILRFPRNVGSIVKSHKDRNVSDTISFDELQEMARAALAYPVDRHSQEDAEWIQRLLLADGKQKYTTGHSQTTSPSKTPQTTNTATISPVRRQHHSSEQIPNFVRTDSEELSADELQHRYERESVQSCTVHQRLKLPKLATQGNQQPKKRSLSQTCLDPRPKTKKRSDTSSPFQQTPEVEARVLLENGNSTRNCPRSNDEKPKLCSLTAMPSSPIKASSNRCETVCRRRSSTFVARKQSDANVPTGIEITCNEAAESSERSRPEQVIMSENEPTTPTEASFIFGSEVPETPQAMSSYQAATSNAWSRYSNDSDLARKLPDKDSLAPLTLLPQYNSPGFARCIFWLPTTVRDSRGPSNPALTIPITSSSFSVGAFARLLKHRHDELASQITLSVPIRSTNHTSPIPMLILDDRDNHHTYESSEIRDLLAHEFINYLNEHRDANPYTLADIDTQAADPDDPNYAAGLDAGITPPAIPETATRFRMIPFIDIRVFKDYATFNYFQRVVQHYIDSTIQAAQMNGSYAMSVVPVPPPNVTLNLKDTGVVNVYQVSAGDEDQWDFNVGYGAKGFVRAVWGHRTS